MNKKIAKSSENQGNWKLTRVNSVTGHPSQELQVSSTSFFSPSYFLCNPVFVGFDEILFWQNAIFTLNVYNGQSQSVPGAFTLFFLRMLKWWLALYCRGYQQCLTYHSSGQTKVLWQHPTIGWKVNNYILHHIYLLVMPISQKPAPRTETSMFVTLSPALHPLLLACWAAAWRRVHIFADYRGF